MVISRRSRPSAYSLDVIFFAEIYIFVILQMSYLNQNDVLVLKTVHVLSGMERLQTITGFVRLKIRKINYGKQRFEFKRENKAEKAFI